MLSTTILRNRTCSVLPNETGKQSKQGEKLWIYRENYFRPPSSNCGACRWENYHENVSFRWPDDYPVRSSSLTKLQLAQVSLPGPSFCRTAATTGCTSSSGRRNTRRYRAAKGNGLNMGRKKNPAERELASVEWIFSARCIWRERERDTHGALEPRTKIRVPISRDDTSSVV